MNNNIPGDEIFHIDGKGPRRDFVKLSFDVPVRILNVDFEYVGDQDDSAFIIGNAEVGFGKINEAFDVPGATASDPNPGDNNNDIKRVDLSNGFFAGTMFRFGEGLDNRITRNDRFRIARIEVEEVPEPTAWALISVGALVAMVFRKKRVCK